jgi:hypothetical protein
MHCTRRHSQEFTGAVDFTFYEADDFRIDHISLTVSADVVAEDLITVSEISSLGSDYDTVVRTMDTVGFASFLLKDFCWTRNGNKVNIAFPNTDANSVYLDVVVQI